MKIELIKLINNEFYGCKYKPWDCCCSDFKNNKNFVLANSDLVDEDKYMDEDGYIMPRVCISHKETWTEFDEEFERYENFPIEFCPHCGEKIEIEIVDEIDISDKMNNIKKSIYELQDKLYSTCDKKEKLKIREQMKEIDNQIEDLYEFGEYKEKLYV